MSRYEGIYFHWNEVPNCDACNCIVMIDEVIEKMNEIVKRYGDCRELAIANTKLNEAQLWLTQVSG